nr:glycosyltransferase [uncultured Holophaga sp.]
MTLSLSMIVKNEEAVLGRCLDSVQGLADEVVILDTGSTDGTAALARGRGARVESFTWVDDFAAARNAAIARCTGDWILVLDADEALDPAEHGRLREALEVPGVEAYRVWMRNHLKTGGVFAGEGAVQRNEAPDSPFSHHSTGRRLRLFRRQEGSVFRGRIHEEAESCFQDRGALLRDLEVTIHHFGKTEVDRDKAKQAGYLRIALQEAGERPEEAPVHYNVLQEALMVEDWAVALGAAERYLALAPAAPVFVPLGAGRALNALGRATEALRYFEAVLMQQPGNAAALTGRGEALWQLGRFEEGQAAFLQSMEVDPAYTAPFVHLAKGLKDRGALVEARRVLEAGLDQNPRDEVLWTHLVGLGAQHEPERVAADAWAAILAVPDGGRGIWHQLVVHALLGQGELEDAREVLRRGLLAFPGDPGLKGLLLRLG